MDPLVLESEIVLATGSPRRRALLRSAGVPFRSIVPHIPEVPRPHETPKAFVRRAAREKAEAVRKRLPAPEIHTTRHIIGCDTLVVLRGTRLGKPAHAKEAADMLRRLAGRTHHVLSGVCTVTDANGHLRRRTLVARTEICFRPLSEAEILRYVASGEPMDKAGGYGIQGGAAGMVRWIRGSYTNVVGLPLAEVLSLLFPRNTKENPSR